MTLASALRDALHVPHPHESQNKVHDILARRLQDLTPKSRVQVTGYFNHSWAPDFVVSSPESGERPVYLRFGVRDAAFSDDLRYLNAERPMFVDLDAAASENPDLEAPDEVDVAAELRQYEDNQVLVTEVPALDEFESAVRANYDVRTATAQVVLGGRGMVDEPNAERIVEAWSSANSAVADASRETLREALDQVGEFLSRIASLDLETTLRARWIATGQAADTFPGQEEWELADRAPWEIARLVASLARHPGEVIAEQWEAISLAISASTLGHELYQLPNTNLEGGKVNQLVRAGIANWTAKYAYVPPLESDSMTPYDWSLGHYSLAVNLVTRVAYFTDLPGKWNRVPRAEQLPDAKARLSILESAGVSGVGLLTAEESVSHELRPTASMPLGERLKQFLGEEGDPAWRAARITWLNLVVPGTSATAHIDFQRSVVKCSDPVPLRTFVALCGKYVAGLTPDELEALESSLSPSTT